MTNKVAWDEVAAYYLSIQPARSSFRDQNRELDRLKQLDRESLENLLKYEVHPTSSVRHVLLKEPAVTWSKRTLALGPLRMGPGAAYTDYCRTVSEDPERGTVEGFCTWLDSKPLSVLLAKDESITSFIPVRPIGADIGLLIVGDRDYRAAGQPLGDRILSGYHRAVVMYLLGRREACCYYATKD